MAYFREWLPAAPGETARDELIFETGAGGKREVVTRTWEDASPALEVAARMRQHQQHGTPEGGMRHVAEIPGTIFARWQREHAERWADTFTFQSYLNWQIERPEYRGFRTHGSRGRGVGEVARKLGMRS